MTPPFFTNEERWLILDLLDDALERYSMDKGFGSALRELAESVKQKVTEDGQTTTDEGQGFREAHRERSS